MGTLRETYGADFAKGYRRDTKLGAVLRKRKRKIYQVWSSALGGAPVEIYHNVAILFLPDMAS